MLLSESYKKRLLELAGILQEKDNRPIITNKMKLPREVADWAHNISDKYSIWIANTFNDYLIQQIRDLASNEVVSDELVRAFQQGRSPAAFKTEIRRAMQSREGHYRHIVDWLTRRQELAPETDIINFKNLTFDEALRRSEVWHDAITQLERGKIEDEDGEVIMTFPDGFYWVNLGKSRCDKEAKAMGHCGIGQGNLYSLRKDGYPYITTDVSSDGKLYQMRGRANTKPKKEFHKYILPFLFDKVEKLIYNSYKPNENFRLSDISKEDFYKILKTKPQLLKGYLNELSNIIGKEEGEAIINQYPELLSLYQIRKMDLGPETLQKIINRDPLFFQNREGISLLDFRFTPEQINNFVNESPEVFYDQNAEVFATLNKQQIRKLIDYDVVIFREVNLEDAGFDDDDIYYLINKDNEILTDKKLEEYLTTDGFKKLYEVNKDRFNSAFINFKYGNEEDYKKIKIKDGKILPNGSVEFHFSEWSDEDLTGLFKDSSAAESIANYDLDFYGYDHSFNDLSYVFDDVDEKNLNTIREMLKKSLGQSFPESAVTTSQIYDILYNDDEYDIEDLNVPGPDEIKTAFTWTVDDCQSNADEGEYWKLYINPIKELFGDDNPTWEEYKGKNKEGKEVTRHYLKFVMNYNKFLDFFRCTENIEGYNDDEFVYNINDIIYPISIVKTCLGEERGYLEINEPYYGVHGDITAKYLNERLSEKLEDIE